MRQLKIPRQICPKLHSSKSLNWLCLQVPLVCFFLLSAFLSSSLLRKIGIYGEDLNLIGAVIVEGFVNVNRLEK